MPWLTPSHGPMGFHPRASGLAGLRAPLALVIFIDERNSVYLSPAQWCVVILPVHISVGKVQSLGGQYGFGHLVARH